MSETFDLIVVGTGAAASTVANRCRAAGWSVAIIDELPYGSTCQLRLRSQEGAAARRRGRGRGLAAAR